MSTRKSPTTVFIPSTRRGNGTAHLRRSLREAAKLRECGASVAVCAVEAGGQEHIDVRSVMEDLFSGTEAAVSEGLVVRSLDEIERFRCLVVDGRSTGIGDLPYVPLEVPIVAIDEGGTLRAGAHYLVDTLPVLPRVKTANVADPGLIEVPAKARSFPERIETVLVSFGGEDPAGLSDRACRAVAAAAGTAVRTTVVVGPSFRSTEFPSGVEVLVRPSRLADLLHRYDLVLTSFGLTAYEAAAAGCAVLLLNPSRYHEKLSSAAGFASMGVVRPAIGLLRRALREPRTLEGSPPVPPLPPVAAGPPAAAAARRTIADVLSELVMPERVGCPVCGEGLNPALERFSGRSFFRCRTCRIVYMLRFDAEKKTYGAGYFFEEYRAQYGRTYLEDFEHIRNRSEGRIDILARVAALGAGDAVLDIGCAYGPFLAAARDRGLRPFGLDASSEAIGYVRDTVGAAAVSGRFPELSFPASWPKAFKAVTMWFVIEHVRNLDTVLVRVRDILEPGGCFAFSTPNLRGVSGRSDLREFLRRSPADHHTLWTRASARRVLARYGFAVVRVRVTGHHPERFSWVGANGAPLVRAAAHGLSRVFGLGDTFEVYARKRRVNKRGQEARVGS